MKTINADKNVVMVVEGYPRLGYKAFGDLISDGTASICISRLHPEYVSEKFSLTGPKFFWLTGNNGEDAISPKNLSQIVKTIKKESKGKKTVVFLDGLEYLMLWNDIKNVISCLEEIGETLKQLDGALYVSIDPLAFEQKDVERIWNVFPKIEASAIVNELSQQSASAEPSTSHPETSGLLGPKGLTASP